MIDNNLRLTDNHHRDRMTWASQRNDQVSCMNHFPFGVSAISATICHGKSMVTQWIFAAIWRSKSVRLFIGERNDIARLCSNSFLGPKKCHLGTWMSMFIEPSLNSCGKISNWRHKDKHDNNEFPWKPNVKEFKIFHHFLSQGQPNHQKNWTWRFVERNSFYMFCS